MRGLLADVHAEGLLASIVRVCRSQAWHEFWDIAGVRTFTMADFALPVTTCDRDLWEFCQREQLLLVTANRNDDSPTSLSTTIRERNQSYSLPVLTIANLDSLRKSSQYRERAAIQMLEIVLEPDRFRGAGRIYLPTEGKS